MKIVNFILLVIIILLGISFACLNAEDVSINYYFNQIKLPLSLLLVMVFGIGIILGLLISTISLFKIKIENRRLKGRINLIEKEVENLRAIPIQNCH